MKHAWRPFTFLLTILFFSVLLIGEVRPASAAGGPISVPAGHQSTPLWLYWNVVGGSLTCQGTTNYVSSPVNETASVPPGASYSSVYKAWTTGVQPSNGGMRIDDINVIGNYRFTCTDTTSGAFDYVDVNVTNPCDASHTWDASTATCKANSNPPATAPILSSPSTTVDYNNPATIPAWTCPANATSNTVNGISVPLNGPYTTPNLTTSTTYSIVCKNADGDSPAGTFTVNVASGRIDAPADGAKCTISTNGTSCPLTFTWNSSNMTSPNIYDATLASTLSTSPSGNQSFTLAYGSHVIQIRNGTFNNQGVTVSAECGPSDSWNGSTCVPSTCSNLANNPLATPSCTQCPDGNYYNSGTGKCTTCDNGGCTGTGGTTSPGNYYGPLVCANGSSDMPTCTPKVFGSCNTTHYSCVSGGSSSNTSLTDRWTWTCTGQYGGSDSGTCTEMKPIPTGSFSTVPAFCDIAQNQSTCTATLDWSTTNPMLTSVITKDGVAGNHLTGNSGPGTATVEHSGSTFRLKNNGYELATATVNGKCQAILYWDNTSSLCKSCGFSGCNPRTSESDPLVCANGAKNAPTCTTCYDGNYWDVGSNSCKACGDTGCDGAGGSSGDPYGGLTCKNGATNVPTCTPLPSIAVGTTFTVSTPSSAHISGGNHNTTASNIASHNETVRLAWLAVTGATSCNIDGTAVSTSGGTRDVVAVGWSGESKVFTLSCSNAGGSVSDTITVTYPKAPTGQLLTCSATGESATATWNSAGLNTYTTTATEKVGSNTATTITDPAIAKTGYSGATTLTFAIDPKGPVSSATTRTRYTVNIQSEASNGALSAIAPAIRDCERPLPTVTLTPHTVYGGTTGSAYYDEPGTAYLEWSTTGSVTSCTLKSNGTTISTTLPANNANYSLPAGDTQNNTTTYDLTCYNTTGSRLATTNIVVPPKPTKISDVCPAPGTSGTVTWSYPGGYTNGYYRIIDATVHGADTNCGTQPGDICINNTPETSKTFSTELNHDYSWWAMTKDNSNANYSNSIGGTVSCRAPNLQAGTIVRKFGDPTTETMEVTDFEAFVTNNGSQNVTTSFKNRMQVSDTYDAGTLQGTGPFHDVPNPTSIASLPVGENRLVTGKYTFPAAGTYAIRACADEAFAGAPSEIIESLETDNCGPWTPITVQALPRVTMDPSTDVNSHYPKTPLTINSTASDADSNLKSHHIKVVAPDGSTYTDAQALTKDGSISVTVGTPGDYANPGITTNSFTSVFTPSHPGTYTISSEAGEWIYAGLVTKQITVDVKCNADEWWKVSDCVKSTADISLRCSNGALNPSTCDRCAPTDVFYNGRCVNAGVCYAEHRNLRPFTCGNGVVDSGEECDLSAGLSNPATQKCTSKCTITCALGASTLNGAPSCGAGTDKVFSAAGEKVTACTNGALQSSAPTCNVCPTGESPVTIDGKTVCKAPVCGNGSTDTGTTEECDGTSGVGAGKFCTSNCCLVNTQPPLSETEQIPEYTLTCNNSDKYQISNSVGTVVRSGNFVDTNEHSVTFKPTTKDTYTYKCIYSVNASVQSEKIATTILPNATSSATGRTTLNISPKSISKNSSVTISWITTYPDNQCSIRAVPVITTPSRTCDASCIASRFRESNRINSDLRLGVTDANDLGTVSTPRNILTAMQTEAVAGGGKAIGKKTVNLNYSTIFYASCSANPIADPSASKVKVSVVGDSEN